MEATVDTQDQQGEVLAQTPRNAVVYQTDALTYSLEPVNELIAKIIRDNAGQPEDK